MSALKFISIEPLAKVVIWSAAACRRFRSGSLLPGGNYDRALLARTDKKIPASKLADQKRKQAFARKNASGARLETFARGSILLSFFLLTLLVNCVNEPSDPLSRLIQKIEEELSEKYPLNLSEQEVINKFNSSKEWVEKIEGPKEQKDIVYDAAFYPDRDLHAGETLVVLFDNTFWIFLYFDEEGKMVHRYFIQT